MRDHHFLNKLTLFFVFAGVVYLSGCKVTRMVPDGEYLLVKNTTELDSKQFDKDELISYYRQKPNRNIFQVVPFFLCTYNFSKLGKPRKVKTWLERVIGEEPSIFDSVLTVKTAKQFELLLKNQAFYNSKVTYEVVKEDKKARVTYQIKLGEPIYINKVTYSIKDTAIASLILSDTINSELKIGQRFAVDFLQKERDRIVKELRDSGYYQFTSELIRYLVDTTDYKANIEVEVNKAVFQKPTGEIIEKPNQQFWINDVFIFPDYDPQMAIRNKSFYYQTFDTVRVGNFYFVYSGKQKITPRTILKANLIRPGLRYNSALIGSTSNYINSLRLFRLNNITFVPVKDNDSLLNCLMQLTPFTYQGYSANFEATNTQGNLGVGGNLNYHHKNLFHGAEILNVKLSGSLQRQTVSKTEAYNIIEFGAESSLETPSFILPLRLTKFYLKYNPKTSFSLAYNFQQRPDYTRTITSLSMTYLWKGNEYLRHFVTPCDFNRVNITNQTKEFTDRIKGKYIENSYKDYFIIGGRYSLVYQDKGIRKRRDFNYFRWNLELAGNLLNSFHIGKHVYDSVAGDHYEIDSLPYAQFTKTDIDYRFYHTMSQRSQLIFRTFAGVAIPYGNATAVPFVRQYYAGGAEGMRGWHVRELGPGAYYDSTASYPNQTGDIKLEANIEYRYDISSTIKGAYFIDIGNIWAFKDKTRAGAQFNKDFYKQLAIGTGIGFRFDLTFAVFRLDGGVKLRDPAIHAVDATYPSPSNWVLFHEPFSFKKIVWQFGIGYPF